MRRKKTREHSDVEFDNGTHRLYEATDRWIVFQAPFANRFGKKVWAAKPRTVGVYISLHPLVAIATFGTLGEAGDFARTASTGQRSMR